MLKYFLFLLLGIYSYFIAPITMNKSFISGELLLAIFVIFLFIKDSKKLFGENRYYLRHSYFFIFVFCIVFYQCNIDYIIGFLDGSEYKIWISDNVVCKSIALSNISLFSLIIGYLKYNKCRIENFSSSSSNRVFHNKTILCLVSYILFGYFLLTVDKSFLNNGYVNSGGQVDSSFGIIVILQAFIISILVLYSIEFKENNYVNMFTFFKYPIILIVLYCIVVILTGRRTEVLRVLSMLIVCIAYIKGKKLNYKKILTVGVALILLFSITGISRSSDVDSLSHTMDVLKNESSIFPPTKELAGSINTLHIVVDNVPEKMSYNLGLTFFPSFIHLIPGLNALCNMIFPKELLITSPTFITRLYWGGDVVYGLGGSMVADVYLSFGLLGLIFVFYMLGCMLKYLEFSTFIDMKVSPYILALSFCVFSQITYAMRTSVAILFISWAYSCILIYLLQKIKY